MKVKAGDPTKLNEYVTPFLLQGVLATAFVTISLFFAFYAVEGVVVPQYQFKGSDDKNKEHARDFTKIWGEKEIN